jgi:hypothetical protein
MVANFEPWSTHFQEIINLVKELFEIEKEKMFVHFKISSYFSHN